MKSKVANNLEQMNYNQNIQNISNPDNMKLKIPKLKNRHNV